MNPFDKAAKEILEMSDAEVSALVSTEFANDPFMGFVADSFTSKENMSNTIELSPGSKFHIGNVGTSEICTIIGILVDGTTEVVVFVRETGEYIAKSKTSFEHANKIGLYTTYPTFAGKPINTPSDEVINLALYRGLERRNIFISAFDDRKPDSENCMTNDGVISYEILGKFGDIESAQREWRKYF